VQDYVQGAGIAGATQWQPLQVWQPLYVLQPPEVVVHAVPDYNNTSVLLN
jgi:hypothetical protein